MNKIKMHRVYLPTEKRGKILLKIYHNLRSLFRVGIIKTAKAHGYLSDIAICLFKAKVTIKRHDDWKSFNVAKRYLE